MTENEISLTFSTRNINLFVTAVNYGINPAVSQILEYVESRAYKPGDAIRNSSEGSPPVDNDLCC